MKDPYSFQYCQKIVLFNQAQDAVLLARRKGEADYDGVYSFIGGKMETTDGGFVEGLKREKNEEIGESARISVCPLTSYNAYFIKKDGSAMVIPHYYAIHQGGEITINDEYSDYKWVRLAELPAFEPKIETISDAVEWAVRMRPLLPDNDFVII
jgi:ADP-ribose pyrophosphatase YjhB (NUDIX family)